MTSTVETGSRIDRIEAPERAFFEREYVDRNRPVILTGVARRWPAISRWTPEYLREVAGDSTITVHFDEGGNFHDWYVAPPAERDDRRIPLSELLDHLVEEGDPRYYMTEHELRLVSPKLVEDIDFSRYIDQGSPYEPLLFLGYDTCMPLHYHGTTEALLCQIQGTKRVVLYGPDQFPYLYPRPWYKNSPLFSEVDGRRPDLQRFPKYAQAQPLDFTLNPGEILFIPVHWWHLTFVDGYQISVTQFWRAKLRNWNFPVPGLQMVAREVLYHARQRFGRAKHRIKSLYD